MADHGFLPGCIGVDINMAIGQILDHVVIAVSCKRELESPRDLVTSIERTVTQIHLCRMDLNKRRGNSTAGSDINASEINKWIINLDELLQLALTVVQKCSIPIRWYDIYSRYRSGKRIAALISKIDKHLKWVTLDQLQQQMQMQMEEENKRIAASISKIDKYLKWVPLDQLQQQMQMQMEEGADIEMGLNQQPEGNNNTDIEMGLNQQPEGNNNTQQESGIVATPHYVQSIATFFATCHGAILAFVALVMMTAPVSSAVRIFILFVSGLVSVAIIRDLGVKSYKEFSAKRGRRSLRNSLLANQWWVTQRIAIFLIFIMFSLGLLLVSNRVLKHH